MTNRQLDEEAIFHVAREIPNRDVRATYLDQVCAGDAPLRERVKALLEVHDRDQEFLKSNGDPALPQNRLSSARHLASRSAATNCCSRLERVASVSSTWPSSSDRSTARWR